MEHATFSLFLFFSLFFAGGGGGGLGEGWGGGHDRMILPAPSIDASHLGGPEVSFRRNLAKFCCEERFFVY